MHSHCRLIKAEREEIRRRRDVKLFDAVMWCIVLITATVHHSTVFNHIFCIIGTHVHHNTLADLEMVSKKLL